MAKPKSGYILRSDIRRIACPTCGAQPGAFCTTFDKREHAERTNVAIAKDASALAGDTAEPQATPSQIEAQALPVEKFPPAAPDPQTEKSAAAVLRDFDDAVQRTLEARVHPLVALGAQTATLVGCRVRLVVIHGPRDVFDAVGELQSIDFQQRRAEISVEPDSESDRVLNLVQWGANDAVRVMGL